MKSITSGLLLHSYAILSGFQLPITLLSSACWVSWAARRTSSLNGFSYRENCTWILSAKQKGSNQTVSFAWGYAICIWERSWDWTFWWLLLNSLSSSLMRSSRIDASFPRRSVFNESKRIGFFAGPKAPLFWVSIPRCRHRWFCSGGPIVHWLEISSRKITGPADCFFGLMLLCLLTLGKSNFREELQKTKVTGPDCSIWSKRFFMFSVLATNSCQNCKVCFWIQLSWMLHSTWGPSSTNPFKKGRSACTCESSSAFSEAKPKWKKQIFSQEPYAKGTLTQSITGCLGAGGMYTPSMSLSLQIVSFPFSTNESLPANCACVPMRVLWTVGIRKAILARLQLQPAFSSACEAKAKKDGPWTSRTQNKVSTNLDSTFALWFLLRM